MPIPTTRVKKEEVNALIESIKAMPPEPEGPHLTDDEFIEYTGGSLPLAKVARIDRHIESCAACCDEMEFLLTLDEIEAPDADSDSNFPLATGAAAHGEVNGEISVSGKHRIEAPGQLEGKGAYAVLWNPFELQKAAATGREVRDETEIYGFVLRYLVEEEGGNLIVTLASEALALEGRKVLLTAPVFSRNITLNLVRKDRVGAETTIERSEREGVPASGALLLRPLEGE